MKIGDLEKKMQENLQTDKAITEKNMQESLNDYEMKLKASLQSVQNIIEADIQKVLAQAKLLKIMNLKSWLYNLILGFSIILGGFLGAEALINFYSWKIVKLGVQITDLENEEKKRKAVLQSLTTFGIETQKNGENLYLILPRNLKTETGTITQAGKKYNAIVLKK